VVFPGGRLRRRIAQRIAAWGAERAPGLDPGEHMRMAADHLVGDAARDVREGEAAVLLGHPRVVDHLEQQVAQFVRRANGLGTQSLITIPTRDPPRRWCWPGKHIIVKSQLLIRLTPNKKKMSLTYRK
jgi:hypothetical protein